MLHVTSLEGRPQEVTLPFAWIGKTAIAAASKGLDMERQLLQLGVNAGACALHADSPIEPAEYLLMCIRVINAVSDEMHGATQARMRPGTAELGVKLLCGEANLGRGVECLFRFYEIAGGFCHAELTRDTHSARITILADGEQCDLTTVVEEMMVTHLHMLFSFYLGFFLPLRHVTTTSARHPRLGERHPYLGAPIVLDRVTQMVFPAAFLDRDRKPSLAQEGPLGVVLHWLACLEPRPGGELGAILKGETSERVYKTLLSEDHALEDCCAVMGLKPRALRALLWAEGTSYRQLRRGALVERVRPYLDVQANADDIAFGLGYSDARSLRRALKLATGLSLSEMRQHTALPASVRPELLHNLRTEVAMMA